MDVIVKGLKFTLLVLAGVSGAATLIFGIGQEGTSALAWIGLSIVLLSFFGYLAIASIVSVVRRLNDYQSALNAAAKAQVELVNARDELESFPRKLREARCAGQMDVIGALLADSSGAVLRVLAMAMVGGALTVIATLEEGDFPGIGARFLLRSRDVGTRRGIVAVDDLGEDRKVFLTVSEVEPGSEAFWEEARKHADVTESAPGKLELVADPLVQEITQRAEI